MKSKATTYLLIIAVVVIWGVIAWKLFYPSFVDTGHIAVSSPETFAAESYDTLMLNYPDPFLKKENEALVVSELPTILPEVQLLEEIREDCRIGYIGHMRQGNKLNYIVESNGVHYSVVAGDIVDKFKLVRTYPDSLIFVKEGISYTITLSL